MNTVEWTLTTPVRINCWFPHPSWSPSETSPPQVRVYLSWYILSRFLVVANIWSYYTSWVCRCSLHSKAGHDHSPPSASSFLDKDIWIEIIQCFTYRWWWFVLALHAHQVWSTSGVFQAKGLVKGGWVHWWLRDPLCLMKEFDATMISSSYLVIEHKLSSHVVFEEILQVILWKRSVTDGWQLVCLVKLDL